jgi:beta-glucuronidase
VYALACFLICLVSAVRAEEPAKAPLADSAEYVKKGWTLRDDLAQTIALMDEAIAMYGAAADAQAAGIKDWPKEDVTLNREMNDVATCLFIKAESYARAGKTPDAVATFAAIIEKYPFAQQWDPRGWFWSVKEKAVQSIQKYDATWCGTHAGACEIKKHEPLFAASDLTLADEGTEFPIDYTKYGTFEAAGTKDFRYILNDREGLAKASGEGVYPNTASVKADPEYLAMKAQVFKIDHWKVLTSRDFKSAFYRWNFAPEPAHVRQFYLGDILERAGYIKQAIKAYHACLVHYPKGYGKTYFNTPWYISKAALARITYLLKAHPEFGYALLDASVVIENGFDNDVNNDVYIVNPGRFVKNETVAAEVARPLGSILAEVGTTTKLVKYDSGDWQLSVDGKPYFIKGITYDPTRVGEAPDDGSLEEWTVQDTNKNGLLDGPYETFVDANGNNQQDADEPTVGDFALLKRMGANTIRRYHQPHKPEKKALRELYEKYGIRTILGDFLGKYTLGSGAPWNPGTDYRNEEHQKAMMESVKQMVLEHKDEPYVLFWLLGNENVYGVACNADKDPEGYYTFVNNVAKMIKELDPSRPVAVCGGDLLYVDVFGRLCPDVDIFGTNAYRGKYGFGDMWLDVKKYTDKPFFLTEYGVSSISSGYTKEVGEAYQVDYHRGTWQDIYAHRAGHGAGNSLGGVAFEYLDEWWKAYEPSIHDERGQFIGPFLDGYIHEEWLGVVGQGDGSKSPFLRVLKPAYLEYERMWNSDDFVVVSDTKSV